MIELQQIFPDPGLIAEVQPEELAAIVLRVLRTRLKSGSANEKVFHLHNEQLALWPHFMDSHPWAKTPRETRASVDLALAEAWVWLRAQGLLVPKPGSSSDWEVLSRRAQDFESDEDVDRFMTARLLPRQLLHEALRQRVWLAFMRGDFDSAVFHAMKEVEVRVRAASGLPADLVGVVLMRRAFDPKQGALTDTDAEQGEREARANLFAGAIGSYKNPQSHRDVGLESAARALEVVLMANHLLAIVDERAKTLGQIAEIA